MKIVGPKFGSNGETKVLLATKRQGASEPRVRGKILQGNSSKANGKPAAEDRVGRSHEQLS